MMRYFLLLLLISACSFKKNQLVNQTQSGHEELYSQPNDPKLEKNDDLKRIVIAATNDLQGHYESHDISFKDRHNSGKQNIKVGGVNYISSYFKIMRQQYGQILLVDSGDIFSSKTQEMNFSQDFYSIMEYDAITVGLSDFNLKLPAKFKTSSDFFKEFASKSKAPLLLSNLYELKTARVVEWPGTLPYLMREVNGVKIGIIGVIPDDIVVQTPVDNRVGLYVDSMVQSTLRYARLLRSLGAEMIVVLSHQGLNCGEGLAQDLNLPLTKVNFEPERSGVCDLSGKMGEFLNRLPPNLVDVVIGGRNHQKTANFVNSTLVLNSFGDGKSFSYAEFFVDAKTGKLERQKTIVHQPVMFCQEFFKETNDCYTEDESVDHKVRTPAQFLGVQVQPDSSVELKFQSFLKPRPVTSGEILKNIQKILDFHEGDISYYQSSTGDAKLIILTLQGRELIKILEQDYNQGVASHWIPSPFQLRGERLALSIQGSGIEADKTYKILADLNDLQNHQGLKNLISRSENKSLNNVSWNEPYFNQDAVSTGMAASETVR